MDVKLHQTLGYAFGLVVIYGSVWRESLIKQELNKNSVIEIG